MKAPKIPFGVIVATRALDPNTNSAFIEDALQLVVPVMTAVIEHIERDGGIDAEEAPEAKALTFFKERAEAMFREQAKDRFSNLGDICESDAFNNMLYSTVHEVLVAGLYLGWQLRGKMSEGR